MLKTKNVVIFTLLIISFSASDLFSQTKSPLDPTVWEVIYDVPATKNVKLKPDVTYFRDAKSNLTIDVYAPPDLKANEKRPAVVFLNAIGDPPNGKIKHWGIYSSYPRLIAAHGMIGISMEADGSRIQENLHSLFDFLAREGDKHGIDGSRIGVYAASANTTQSLIYLMSDRAAKGIRAAALFYGATPATGTQIRKDLPVLYILAEGDLPSGFGQQSAGLWQRVSEARAPWTLMFASRMPHAFDAFTDNDESRRIIQQTIAFWKSHLEPVPQPAWKPSPNREIMEAIYFNDHTRAAELLAKYTVENPTDAQGFAQLGRRLQLLNRSDEAVAAFQKALAIEPNNLQSSSGIGQIYYTQKKYAEAIDFLSKAIAGGFRNPFIYFQIATSQLILNRNDEAIKNYENALEIGATPNLRPATYYNLAIAYGRLKQNDKAFELLNKAIDEGFKDRKTLETDTDLAPLRVDARFQQTLARLPQMPKP